MTTLAFGVLGAARVAATAVIPALQTSIGARVVAVAARELPRAREFAGRHAIGRSYGSYAELLADPEVEAVYIALPNSEHARWSLRALSAGKHVLCEKPLGVAEEEAIAISSRAQETGLVAMEALMWLFHPQVDLARETLAAGRLGELTGIRSHFAFTLDKDDDIRWVQALGGGALLDLGTYCVAGSLAFAEGEPTGCRATATWTTAADPGGGGVDRSFAGEVRFSNGLVAKFDCSLAERSGQYLELTGSEGVLTMMEPWLPPESENTAMPFDPPRLSLDGKPVGSVAANPYQLMADHFVHTVRTGEAPLYSLAQSRERMRLADQLRESARWARSSG